VLRIDTGIDTARRFPDWDALLVNLPIAGQCVQLYGVGGEIVRSQCAGTSLLDLSTGRQDRRRHAEGATRDKGAVIKTFTTGLRMGADYSWVRGVTWLMKNRVLASREKP
jgi:hypothetical protein